LVKVLAIVYILVKKKNHSNVSPAEWTSVPHTNAHTTPRNADIHRGPQLYEDLYIDQTHFAAVGGCPYCGFRRYYSILS